MTLQEKPPVLRRRHAVAPQPAGASRVVSAWREIFLGFRLFLGLLALALPLSLWSFTAALVAAFLAGLLLAIVETTRWDSAALLFAAFAAVLAAIGSVVFLDKYRAAAGIVLADAEVADISRRPEATIFYFRDARVAADKGIYGAHWTTDRNGNRSHAGYRGLAPVVPERWRAGDPVHAWAMCRASHSTGCADRFRSAYRAVLAVPAIEAERLAPTVRSAEQRWNLVSAPGARVVEWVRDPIGDRNFHLASAISIPVIVFLLWSLGTLGVRTWRGRSA